MNYEELIIRFGRGEGDEYTVEARGPTGETSGMFRLPITQLEVENLSIAVTRGRSRSRRIESPAVDRAHSVGERLFDELFKGEVRDLYRESYTRARDGDKGLQIKLVLDRTPQLMGVPWELLREPPRFLCTSLLTPVIRQLGLPRTHLPFPLEPPIRVLGMVSSPKDKDLDPLNVEEERALLTKALSARRLLEEGLVELEWVAEANLRSLQSKLRESEFHVFHYVGHGGYCDETETSILLFEDAECRPDPVDGVSIATTLGDYPKLRLVVLNACEAARVRPDDPFASVATTLVEYGVPSVIGMQFEITDRAAIILADEFYSSLVAGLPVDAALTEARKAIFGAMRGFEWATPVLFLQRGASARIFDVTKAPNVLAREGAAQTSHEGSSSTGATRQRKPQKKEAEPKPSRTTKRRASAKTKEAESKPSRTTKRRASAKTKAPSRAKTTPKPLTKRQIDHSKRLLQKVRVKIRSKDFDHVSSSIADVIQSGEEVMDCWPLSGFSAKGGLLRPMGSTRMQASHSYAIVTMSRLILIPAGFTANQEIALVGWRRVHASKMAISQKPQLIFKVEHEQATLTLEVAGASLPKPPPSPPPKEQVPRGRLKRVLGFLASMEFDPAPDIAIRLDDVDQATKLRDAIKERTPAAHHFQVTRRRLDSQGRPVPPGSQNES